MEPSFLIRPSDTNRTQMIKQHVGPELDCALHVNDSITQFVDFGFLSLAFLYLMSTNTHLKIKLAIRPGVSEWYRGSCREARWRHQLGGWCVIADVAARSPDLR